MGFASRTHLEQPTEIARFTLVCSGKRNDLSQLGWAAWSRLSPAGAGMLDQRRTGIRQVGQPTGQGEVRESRWKYPHCLSPGTSLPLGSQSPELPLYPSLGEGYRGEPTTLGPYCPWLLEDLLQEACEEPSTAGRERMRHVLLGCPDRKGH